MWDFDGTLAHRRGETGWSILLAEALDTEEPGHGHSAETFRPHLRDGFPWHRPEVAHPELCEPDAWWASVRPLLSRAYQAAGHVPARALPATPTPSPVSSSSWRSQWPRERRPLGAEALLRGTRAGVRRLVVPARPLYVRAGREGSLGCRRRRGGSRSRGIWALPLGARARRRNRHLDTEDRPARRPGRRSRRERRDARAEHAGGRPRASRRL